MKASKERKMERKRKNKEISVAKTVKSRQRRLDNKAKRDEIHAIDPDMKVKVINQVTYDEDGAIIKVENSKIAKWLPVPELFKSETVEIFNDETEEMEAVEVNDVSGFKKLTNKWRL